MRLLLHGLKHKPRRRRLADARRPVEQKMLRIGRGQFRLKRLHRTLLPHDFHERLRPQKLHHRLGKMNLLEFLQFLALLCRLRRFNLALLFLQHLHPDVLHIVLVVLLKLFLYLLFDLVFQVAPRHNIGNALRKLDQDAGNLLIRRHALDRRVLVDDALQGKNALAAHRRTHQAHGVHLAGLDDETIRTGLIRKYGIERIDLTVEAIPRLTARGRHCSRCPRACKKPF